ncbi:hypothetical protein AB4187_17320 [Vibrio breoganii]
MFNFKAKSQPKDLCTLSMSEIKELMKKENPTELGKTIRNAASSGSLDSQIFLSNNCLSLIID